MDNFKMDMTIIENRIIESISTKQKILEDKLLIKQIGEVSDVICKCFMSDGKVLLCGNGGSASDALHIAGELVGRFQKDRKPMPAIALSSDMAVITSIANDYGYDCIYERQIEGLLNPGDVLIGISTSGNSENVYKAIKKTRELNGHTIALLGNTGGKIRDAADYSIIVPSDCTARIQECHIMIGHIICELVEDFIAGL